MGTRTAPPAAILLLDKELERDVDVDPLCLLFRVHPLIVCVEVHGLGRPCLETNDSGAVATARLMKVKTWTWRGISI